jgi:hypothetical protein
MLRLFRWHRRFEPINRPLLGKVFGIGFNKTGTTSLAAALARLGYRVAPQSPAVRLFDQVWHHQHCDELLRFCQHYDAFQDIPFSMPGVYRLIDAAFPKAKFILTTRANADIWFDSLYRFTAQQYQQFHGVAPTLEAMQQYPVGTDWIVYKVHRFVFEAGKYGLWNRERYQGVYERHNAGARDYFRDRPTDFLELDVAGADALDRLSTFLGFAATGDPMPHLNESAPAAPISLGADPESARVRPSAAPHGACRG